MKFVKFEERKDYDLNNLGILCDYEAIPTDDATGETSVDSVYIDGKWYIDPNYMEDLGTCYSEYLEPTVWWESRYYYDKGRVVLLDTVDTNIYMFDIRYGSQVFRKPSNDHSFGETGCVVYFDEGGHRHTVLENDVGLEDDDVLDWNDYDELSF